MLRSITTLAIATLTFSTAFAQEASSKKMRSPMRKGTLSAGLNVDLPQLTMDYDRKLNFDIRLNPNAGYFLTNNLLLVGQVHGGAYQLRTNYLTQLRGQFIGTGFDFRW